MSNRYFAAAGVICLLTALPSFAQDTAEHNRRTALAKGATVVIEGCVAPGQKPDTYVLGTVKEVEAVPVAHLRKRIYWLENTKEIQGHLGHQVRITGRVNDLERSEIEVDLGVGPKGGAVAKIEGPGGAEVKVLAAEVGLSQAAKPQSEVDVKTTLVKMKINKVTRLAGTCP